MQNPLILKYNLTIVLAVQLPIFNYTGLSVNWGSTGSTGGSINEYIYDSPGIKTIYIYGNIPTLNCGVPYAANSYITECVSFGDVGLTKISFGNAIRLTKLPLTLPSTVTDLSYLCSFTTFNQDISSWDTSRVTNFNYCFYNNPVYDQPVWTSVPVNSCTRTFMFQRASSFNQNIGLMSVSNTTNMDLIFKDTNISVENFTNAYKSWATQSNLLPCSFKGSFLIYTEDAEQARQQLISQHNWSIEADILLKTPPIKINKPITLQYNTGLWDPSLYGISIIVQNSSVTITPLTTNLEFNLIFPTSGRVILPVYTQRDGVIEETPNKINIYVPPDTIPTPIPTIINMKNMGSLFSNNAMVYYKPHSLAPGGVGSVRNYRKKSKKT
jgi:hypothetical protein